MMLDESGLRQECRIASSLGACSRIASSRILGSTLPSEGNKLGETA